MSECWVMCGGPSAREKLTVEGDIIAVNKDAFRYPEAKYVISMDNRFNIWELQGKDRKLPEGPANIFVVNMAYPHMDHKKSFVDKRWGMSYDLSYYDLIIKSYRVKGFGKTFKDFANGNSSGFSALQLALILGYKTIHLVGLDLVTDGDETHWHDGYPKSRDDAGACLEEQFSYLKDAISGLKGVRLISHSPASLLNDLKEVEVA